MLTKKQMNPAHHRDFTLSYFGAIMGECESIQKGAVWWKGGDVILVLNDDGTAHTFDNWGDCSEQMYSIVGYCAFHKIPLSGIGLITELADE